MGYRPIDSDKAADEYEVVYKVMDIKDPAFAIDFEEVVDEKELEKMGFRCSDDELPF